MAKFLLFLIFILVKAHLILAMAESPIGSRKLGKHSVAYKIRESRLMAAEAPEEEERGENLVEVSASGGEGGPAGEEEVMKVNHHHRRSIDKSVAGGGVILGGLATTFLVVIICYIRATRRRPVEPASPTNSDSSVGRENGNPGSLVNS